MGAGDPCCPGANRRACVAPLFRGSPSANPVSPKEEDQNAMPPVAAPVWWEDVQQEREDFAGRTRRPVDEWLEDDVDFAPRRRLPRSSPDAAVVLELDLEPRGAAE